MEGLFSSAAPAPAPLFREMFRLAGAAPRIGPSADWGRVRADVVRFGAAAPNGSAALRVRPDWHTLALVLDGTRGAIGLLGGREVELRPGRLDALPARHELRGRIRLPQDGAGGGGAGGPTWFVLRLDPDLAALDGVPPSGSGVRALADLRDPMLREAVGLLRRELERPAHPAPALLAEALGLLLLARLREAAAPRRPPAPRRAGTPRLAGWRLRRCIERMDDNLAGDIGLDDLASAAGLSPVYFARSFRAATGLAPHAYLIRRRVERAKALLAEGGLPLAEVALACGFSDQAHLGRAFRKLAGSSPAAYRRTAQG